MHAIVATGKTDWLRDVKDEKGSVMMALGKEAKGSDCQVCIILCLPSHGGFSFYKVLQMIPEGLISSHRIS